MSDTRQVVSWSLERKCAYRSGDQWFLPDQTHTQLSNLRTVASAEDDGRNVEGICVVSWTMGEDNAGNVYDIPCDGYLIDERLKAFGGLEGARLTCRDCEANAKTELGIDVAGCFGHLDVWPDSEELERELWRLIEQHHLEERLRSAFPVTRPLWYGFWIKSPLRRLQAEFLHELLSAACDNDDPQDKDLRHFLNALQAAIRWELPVHVALAPLGHADMGWYTVFPHCPRCKANAPVGRWRESYPTMPYECQVCGHTFIPDEHHSSEQNEFDLDADGLEEKLGKAEHERLTRAFLLHRGCSAQQVDEVIDNENNGPVLRRIKAMRNRRNATLRQLRRSTAPPLDGTHPTALSIALADGIDMEFVLVPAGAFNMGAPGPDARPNELPQHPVRIPRAFYIGRFPVTQAQWTAVMGKNPSAYQGHPGLPVDGVNWFDCQEFCERLCTKHARVFRLPSEAEWEYACRAGTTAQYAFGDTLLPSQANFTPSAILFAETEACLREMESPVDNAEATSRRRRTTTVGTYPPNAWGIHDMHGNVNEWCEDAWHPNYAGAPTDGIAWLDDEYGTPFRVARGGWASATEAACTSSCRLETRADAGSPPDLSDVVQASGLLSTFLENIYTPYGLRAVCEQA